MYNDNPADLISSLKKNHDNPADLKINMNSLLGMYFQKNRKYFVPSENVILPFVVSTFTYYFARGFNSVFEMGIILSIEILAITSITWIIFIRKDYWTFIGVILNYIKCIGFS